MLWKVEDPEVAVDEPTKYLRAVLRLVEDPLAVDDELESLQGFGEYSEPEWARADVLVEIAGRLAELRYSDDVIGPRPGSGTPVVRVGAVGDAEAVVAMHERCSYESRTRRYHVPMAKLTARTARHLVAPVGGASVLAVVGDAVVGMATAAPWEELGSRTVEVAVLVEDGWQRQGLGARLLRGVIAEARRLGADRAICVVRPDNTAMLRTIEGLRMRTRVVTEGDNLAVTVALTAESLLH